MFSTTSSQEISGLSAKRNQLYCAGPYIKRIIVNILSQEMCSFLSKSFILSVLALLYNNKKSQVT